MYQRQPIYLYLLCLALLILPSCKIGRFIFYNFADIQDHNKFPSRPVTAPAVPFRFISTDQIRVPGAIKTQTGSQIPFERYLEDNGTVAFLVIKNDSLQYEKYFSGYDQTNIVPSFSMAKSVISILIGCAIDEGLIKSVNEPVTAYVPELKKNGFDRVNIEHLLQMTSGLDFKESYFNPFGEAASYYYGRNLRKMIPRLKLKHEPGTIFEYVSGNPQILGLVLERALKGRTVTDYLQEKLWQPLGMEYEGSWSIDKKKDGLEKTFCCINARARDFAKIGRLYLKKGNWNGKQLLSEAWVKQSTKIDTQNGAAWYYQYQWWLPNKRGDFMAAGILGQYIFVSPARNLIIVRLGKNKGKADWDSVFQHIASSY